MKKITLLLSAVLLFSALSFGQKAKKTVSTKPKIEVKKRLYLIEYSDFEKKDDMVYVNKKFKFKAGDDKEVDVKIFIASEKTQLDSVGIEKINYMLDYSNSRSKYSAKNKYTYVPRKLSLLYSDKDLIWSVMAEFTAQNDMGAIKDALVLYKFDKKGEFIR